ncbi:MAG: hypothetical protein A3K03_02085 [Bdellovibrionales bacterium RIFOXYD1_FULL_44_7]|nr:MAG: hypothetical protein A3K03_02085 [Bdellovibrionales bacterium RIFOXYD1_FULL_44_7]
MTFLDKLLGRKNKPVQESATIKRAPRFLRPLTGIQFRRIHDGGGVGIFNLSSTGIGLKTEDLLEPKSGLTVKGELIIEGTPHSCEINIVHVTGSVAGGFFVGAPEDIVSAVNRYFQIEMEALSLTPVNQDLLNKDEGTPYWFQGCNNNELYLVVSKGNVKNFNLTFFGNYIEGGTGERTRVGFVVEDQRDDIAYKGSSTIRWEHNPNPKTVEMAVKFIKHVRDIPTEVQTQLLELMSRIT